MSRFENTKHVRYIEGSSSSSGTFHVHVFLITKSLDSNQKLRTKFPLPNDTAPPTYNFSNERKTFHPSNEKKKSINKTMVHTVLYNFEKKNISKYLEKNLEKIRDKSSKTCFGYFTWKLFRKSFIAEEKISLRNTLALAHPDDGNRGVKIVTFYVAKYTAKKESTKVRYLYCATFEYEVFFFTQHLFRHFDVYFSSPRIT